MSISLRFSISTAEHCRPAGTATNMISLLGLNDLFVIKIFQAEKTADIQHPPIDTHSFQHRYIYIYLYIYIERIEWKLNKHKHNQ